MDSQCIFPLPQLISKAPRMDPAMPPHRPGPPTGSCGTWTNKKWMEPKREDGCWPLPRAEIKGSPVEKGDLNFLNFRGMVKVEKKITMKFDWYNPEDLEFRWVKFGKIQNAEKKNQVKMSALPGTEMAMLSSELLLSWSRFWHFGGFSDSDDYPTILGLFSSPFSWGNTSFLAPNSS